METRITGDCQTDCQARDATAFIYWPFQRVLERYTKFSSHPSSVAEAEAASRNVWPFGHEVIVFIGLVSPMDRDKNTKMSVRSRCGLMLYHRTGAISTILNTPMNLQLNFDGAHPQQAS